MAKLFFSTSAALLLVVSMASVVDIQCKAKENRLTYMPADEPPYDK